jgi:uncharacterized protein (DUF1778 family)
MSLKGKGGPGRSQGRKAGSSPESRLIQKHYRVNADEFELIERAAESEGKKLAKFVADSAVEKAKSIVERG